MSNTGLTIEGARLVILMIGAAGVVVWLVALVLRVFTRRLKPPPDQHRDLHDKDPVQVRDSLSRAAALQTPPWDLIGGDKDHAIFAVPIPARPQVRIDVVADTSGGVGRGCRVTGRIEHFVGGGWLNWVMNALLALIPAVIVGLGTILWTQAAPSTNPGARAQVWQMYQIIHVLWPPFMFWGMRFGFVRMARYQRDRYLTTVELL